MKQFATALCAGLLTVACGAPAARAQQPAGTPVPLTDDSLLAMLKNMGYAPRIEKTPKGNIYSLTIQRGTWTYYVDVSLSPSKTKLWLSGWLSALPRDEKVPAERLLALLEGSWTHGPAHFRYHRGFRQLNIGLCLDNREITPETLRTQLESFLDTMKKSEELWNVKKWKPGEPVSVGRPAGTDKGK